MDKKLNLNDLENVVGGATMPNATQDSSYHCNDCGYEWTSPVVPTTCPKCHKANITKTKAKSSIVKNQKNVTCYR